MFGERYPELPPRETIPDDWRLLGFASTGAMGGALPFSWQEVFAFSSVTGIDLSPTVARVLVDMSRAYASALTDKNPLSIPPMERQGYD